MDKVHHLQRIALALARDATLREMAELVTNECRLALDADAVCIYLLRGDDWFEMICEVGCTPEFKNEWHRVPKSLFPLTEHKPSGSELFLGTQSEFSQEVPMARELAKRSGRLQIGYAPLSVNKRVIGLLGFSYNRASEAPEDKPFISLLMNLCSQALERARLSEAEKAASRAKSDFLANISHEVRTPLGLIQGYTELLCKSSALTDEQKNWANIVHRNTRQLVQLIGEVLDIAKIEAAKMETHPVFFNLKDLIEDVRQTATLQAIEKKIELKIDCENLPAEVYTDPSHLRQILLNLVCNAVKFTPKGYVEMKMRMLPGDELEAVVLDTGIGIAKEHHQRIFEPFTQVDGSTRRVFGGTGLGLSISRALARALEGDLILVSSTPGFGSVFRVTVKVRVRKSRSPCKTDTETSPGKGVLAGMRVLVVEDSLDNQELVRLLLTKQGAEVELASSGAEGVKRALNSSYDAILMDIQMPDMDGNQTLSVLRKRNYSGVVVALTAHALKTERERSLGYGFDDYLTKPIESNVLVQTLKRLTS